MGQYILKRLASIICVLFVISMMTFLGLHLVTKDMAVSIAYNKYKEENIHEDVLEKVRDEYGLNDPILVQYGNWLKEILSGNLGESYVYDRPVLDIILGRLPNTLTLGIIAFFVSLIISIPFGIICALNHNKLIDNVGRIITMIFSSFPTYWVGLMLIIIFAVNIKIFPVAGKYGFSSMILPVITLSLGMITATTRMMRTSLLDVMDEDYMTIAKAKGLRKKEIIIKHGLRNAIPPVVTIIGIQIGHILGGSVIVETVFSWPGIGSLLTSSVLSRDLPVLEGCVLLVAVGYALINLVVDIVYSLLNPSVRYGAGGGN